jgi:LacI family transcriptional regulator
MATIYDVAKRARVSTYTVSVVLSGAAKVSPELTARVLKAAQQLDYTINRIASSLQMRKTMTIGMLIPDIGNPWFAKVVKGVEDVCRENEYSLFLGNTSNSADEQARYLTVFRSRQVDGVLLFMAANSDEALAALIQSKKLPIVFVGRRPRLDNADFVAADNRLGTRLAVTHLIQRGHTRIAILTGQLSLLASKDRVDGWRESLKKAGFPAPREFVKAGDWTAASAQLQMQELLNAKHPPTAVFASNLLMMIGVLAALQERSLSVPADIDVMCSDDSEWLDVFSPRISVVLQPSYEMGVAAARLILRRIAHPRSAAQQVILKPTLKLRS